MFGAFILMGIFTAFVMAGEGDFSGFLLIGKIIVYIVLGGLGIWFLAVTGWAGAFLIVLICFLIGAWDSVNK